MNLTEKIAAVEAELVELKQQLTSQISEQKEHDIQQRIIENTKLLSILYQQQNAQADALVEFKFPSKVNSREDEIFPKNGVGNALFNRKVLVSRFLEDLFDSTEQSFYIRGPKGSGKTMLLHLIGQELQRLGETVYVVKHADFLRKLNEQDFKRLEDKLPGGKKLYLLIDEVHQNTTDGLWNYLLKETEKTITIGFGIPVIEGTSPSFERKYEPSFVMLTKEDFSTEEELLLLGHGASVSDTSMISDLVDWMLEYTGGHAYPCLKLCEYMLRDQKRCCDKRNFELVVNSGTFYGSSIFNTIVARSYDLPYLTRQSAYRILETGTLSSNDVFSLNKVGLWNGTNNWFLSNLVVSYVFQTSQNKDKSIPDYIDLAKSDGLEKVLLYGLSELTEDDFQDSFSGMQRYENAIGSIFAIKLSNLPYLFISPQTQIIDKSRTTRGSKPTIDFFLNGRLMKYLELTRNGVDLAKHFDKFENPDGKYYVHREKYAILDFDLSTNSSIVKVPEKYQNKGLDKRLYSFVKRENALYVGNQRVHSNVSKFLKSSAPVDMGIRMYTTSNVSKFLKSSAPVDMGIRIYNTSNASKFLKSSAPVDMGIRIYNTSNASKFLKSSAPVDMGIRMCTTLPRLFQLNKLCK